MTDNEDLKVKILAILEDRLRQHIYLPLLFSELLFLLGKEKQTKISIAIEALKEEGKIATTGHRNKEKIYKVI